MHFKPEIHKSWLIKALPILAVTGQLGMGVRGCKQKKGPVLCVRLINYHLPANEKPQCCHYSKLILVLFFFKHHRYDGNDDI